MEMVEIATCAKCTKNGEKIFLKNFPKPLDKFHMVWYNKESGCSGVSGTCQ
jgi:hypothetical protein